MSLKPIKCSRPSSDRVLLAGRIGTFFTLVMLCACATNRPSKAGPAALEPLQRGAMQTRELQGDFETAYAATLSVLQDHGWQLDTIDKASGIIQASSLKHQDILGPEDEWRRRDSKAFEAWKREVTGEDGAEPLPKWTRWEQLTAHIEAWGPGTVRERVSIVQCGACPSMTRTVTERSMFGLRTRERTVAEPAREQSVQVDNPGVYVRLFEEIGRAVFIRNGLTRTNK